MNPFDPLSFQNSLRAWYEVNKRDLPWRHINDPYKIWVSEVMLQQTQVKTVIPYFNSFMAHFPDVRTLARADLNHLLKIWEGLGYYARARNMHKAASQILLNHQGRIPQTIDQFCQLPGVGPYICAAVLSIAFQKPYAVVDGNVKRVLARLMADKVPVNHSNAYSHYHPIAQNLLNKKDPGNFNQAIMEIGAIVCTPKSPQCPVCPLTIFCKAFNTDRIDEFPQRMIRKKIPLYHIAAGVIYKGDKLLITQRKPEGLLGGLWEFPGGKITESEEPETACIREIKEEVGIDVDVVSHLVRIKHAYTHFKIEMDVFCCTYVSGEICLNGPVDCKWVRRQELENFAFPKANLKFIHRLKKELS